MTERLLQMAKLPAGTQVLELGCGNGQTALYLQQKGYQVTAIDRETADNPNIRQGDMLRLDFPADMFDAVLAECSLSASGDPLLALTNAYRVLKVGGHLLISDVFFRETDGEQAEKWMQMVQQAGFAVVAVEDASKEAQTFFLKMIWEQGCLPDQWKRIAAGRKKVGYVLLCGRKK